MADLMLRSAGGRTVLDLRGADAAHSERWSVHLFGRLWSVGDRPETSADAVLREIERSGPSAIQTLDGEWGLMIEDKDQKDLLIVANHVGSIPFYYAETARGLFLSTSLGRLVGEADLAIDGLRARQFLAKGKKAGIAPLFAGAKRMMGRELIRIDKTGHVEKNRYFDWPIDRQESFDAAAMKRLILDPIRLAARPPLLPAAVAFSGGMDSSVIAAVMKETEGFRCYSIDAGPEADNEEDAIDETCRLWKLGHDYVPASTSLDDLLAVVGYAFEPVRELKTMTTLISIARRATEDGARQLLVGLGPDMVLAGAQKLILPYLATLTRQGHLVSAFGDSIKLGAYSRQGTLGLWKRMIKGARHGEDGFVGKRQRHDFPRHVREPEVPGLEVTLDLDVKRAIAGMMSNVGISCELRAVERLWGLPLISPLYSRHLARYCLSRDVRELMRGGRYKAMMRRALADVLPRHLTEPRIKKKVPSRASRHMVFDAGSRRAVEGALEGSSLLSEILASGAIDRFRASRAGGEDADFWLRCLQLSTLESAAAGAVPAEPFSKSA